MHFLALKLPCAADGLCLLAGAPFGRLLIELATFHFTEGALTLHLLLQRAKGLLDIIVADDDRNDDSFSSIMRSAQRPQILMCGIMRYRAAGRMTRS